MLLIGEPWHKCTNCEHNFSDEEVKTLLLDWFEVTKDNVDEGYEANRGECQGYRSVVLRPNDKWICSNCFVQFEHSDIGACNWCTEKMTEDVEDSFLFGCEFCDGSVGRYSDD